MKQNLKISGGLYLVLDPAMPRDMLLHKLKQALPEGVRILQIWNNWPGGFQASDKKELISAIIGIASKYQIPVLINEDWGLLKETALSGVHFDHIPENYDQIRSAIDRDFVTGITCSNDLKTVKWADQNHLDYISFCAIFPSKSVGDCEIVAPKTVKKASAMTKIPLFISGGITVENLMKLKDLDISGIAVISGILSSDSPDAATLAYVQALNELKI